jgi:uncharacterized protein (DUF1684 family)
VDVRRVAASIVVGLALLPACDRSGVTMSPVPPPRSWEREVAAARREKDAVFAADPESPIPRKERAAFHGLAHFPPDPTWRYAGWVERYPSPERISMVTTGGAARPCERWGRVTFTREGRVLILQVYRLLDLPDRAGGDGLFLPFKDETTGKQTYAAGRYVDLVGPDGGPFVLDFNLAYNPSCAYGEPERFQCPVTPAENRLPISVIAGERGPDHVEGESQR